MKRDLVIAAAAAVADGRIPAERIAYYQQLWDNNPSQAASLIGMLAPSPLQPRAGTIENVHRIAQVKATASAAPADDTYPREWLPETRRQDPRTVEFELGTLELPRFG